MSTQEPAPAASPIPNKATGLSSPHIWVSTTHFAEGYSYAIVHTIADKLFNALGASLTTIGLTSLFHLPWNLKFLSAPFLDRFESKRFWIWLCQLCMLLISLGLALAVARGAPLGLLALLFVVLAIFAANQDAAVDGYYLEALSNEDAAKFVGYRAPAFRVATLAMEGPLLLLIAAIGWETGMLVLSGILALITIYHFRFLPVSEARKLPLTDLLGLALRPRALALLACFGLLCVAEWQAATISGVWHAFVSWRETVPLLQAVSGAQLLTILLFTALLLGLLFLRRLRRFLVGSDSAMSRAYLSFLEQPRAGTVLAFIILFRLGESLLTKMRWPFLDRELGYSLEAYSLVNGTIGVAATIVATVFGGWLIGKQGLRRWLLPFMLLQNGLNLSFVALAGIGFEGLNKQIAIAAALTGDNLASGLGTAALMIYYMRCVHEEHRAGHMAIVTSIMSVGWTLSGMVSGLLADSLGFVGYFLLTFVASIPAMLLVRRLPHLDGHQSWKVDPLLQDADSTGP